MTLYEKIRQLDELLRLLELRVDSLERAQQIRLDRILNAHERRPEALNQASAVDDVKTKTGGEKIEQWI